MSMILFLMASSYLFYLLIYSTLITANFFENNLWSLYKKDPISLLFIELMARHFGTPFPLYPLKP